MISAMIAEVISAMIAAHFQHHMTSAMIAAESGLWQTFTTLVSVGFIV
jgi:hypothetical protein